ncbi:ATPase domain-containing protein [Occallatibacter riparius]|uniref:non-specific serine/threonine protein kinase n=1 Tax=Occallatibacter riparius TaxID=1002689 RepID=A0A9J7BQV0_9BACT|nr:ATPase domain-containing protein [Occallatibacter riparius]UWZ84959.1 AAA family ATPase [Occallatibacter riparius]
MQEEIRLSTGIAGLDKILHGGLANGFLYLVEGSPGAGKTTLALQFLMEGAKNGEPGLYISLAESEAELRHVAASHGFNFDNITICKISPPEIASVAGQTYTVFQPAEVELADVVETILGKVREINPKRVCIDSMSELRMLARDSLRYRRQVLALKEFFEGRDCTTLLLDERFREQRESQVQTIAHGVISLEVLPREYGVTRRRLEVTKVRASSFREGYHDYVILKGGLRVFPRLVSGEHRGPDNPQEDLPSGIEELDAIFNGGVQRGTSTLIAGPTGCGKSTLCCKWAYSAALRGERTAIFTFDETKQSFLDRSRGLGMELTPHLESEAIHLEQLDPAELSPGEFVERIREGVEQNRWTIVIIDSLNGLMNSMSEERAITVQLHELLSYLNQVGVASFLVLAQFGLLGQSMSSPADVSYLADNVLLLRYFEAQGEVRQALSAVKRRSGPHERSIRELQIKDGKICIGEPLRNFVGVLTGTPRYKGGQELL